MKQLVRRVLVNLCWISGVLVGTPDAAPLVNVEEELQRLMAQHGFEVRGIEQTVDMEGRAEGAELVPRLRLLLDSFDHVIVQTDNGGVDQIIILGEKVAVVAPPLIIESEGSGFPSDVSPDDEEGQPGDSIVLPTQRQGTSHAVNLTLEGPNGQRVQRVLLIDTGSDHVVLPASLIGPLGISPNDLRMQSVQTANGTVDARLGILSGVWLGETRVEGVSAAFIDDTRLGGNALLGMSLLGRFRVTIDDEQNQLTLAAR
ncbi:retropepsin-like aspartic protease family protein [Thiocapsa roseopersicina]|uniref:Clan AA aspartic protease, TIGR02281 family n=1 Tax=Thiocapsa roseopersicina TaxID=1058 RepID=A0A1H2RG77_THIRO|nr:retropepsin-like aspartic protease [Thiocapsa roseopersicina]SDW18160.1 clan AA aspartic protease, TIGR02281 family [Thiocapsa roseopersicina]